MKISLIQVGKTSQAYLQQGIEEYENRLKHYCNFETITVIGAKGGLASSIEQSKMYDSNQLMSKLAAGDFVILLDDKGKEFSSEQFSTYINQHQINATKKVVFLIGGPYGFSNALYERANAKISLSKLTFSHQMVRLFFVEQLYRAFTIIKGESYHHS